MIGPEEVAEAIREHAAEEWPNECCGFVVAYDTGVEVKRMRNAANDPENEFFIDPREQYDALNEIEDRDAQLIAVYHSHPRGTTNPSERDLRFAAGWPGVAMLICAKGAIEAYTASGEYL